MNYATIKYCDIANGEGVRTSLFVSGCRRHCPNCFNAVAWDFHYGQPFTREVRNQILESLAPEYINGLSLLGGEPLEPENQAPLLSLARQFKARFPEKTLWCYTGFSFEADLLTFSVGDSEILRELLSYMDVLVDGRFMEEKKDLSLIFRGSSNQNIIDVPKSLEAGRMILLEGTWRRTMGNGDISGS